jgi:ribosomal protein L22
MSIFCGFKNKSLIETIFPCEIKYKETRVASLCEIHKHDKKRQMILTLLESVIANHKKSWVTLEDTLRKRSIITYKSPISRRRKTKAYGDNTFGAVLS